MPHPEFPWIPDDSGTYAGERLQMVINQGVLGSRREGHVVLALTVDEHTVRAKWFDRAEIEDLLQRVGFGHKTDWLDEEMADGWYKAMVFLPNDVVHTFRFSQNASA